MRATVVARPVARDTGTTVHPNAFRRWGRCVCREAPFRESLDCGSLIAVYELGKSSSFGGIAPRSNWHGRHALPIS